MTHPMTLEDLWDMIHDPIRDASILSKIKKATGTTEPTGTTSTCPSVPSKSQVSEPKSRLKKKP